MAQRNWITVKSSRFLACDYDPLLRDLFVKFHPNRAGESSVYVYHNVSDERFHDLMEAESKGKALNEIVNDPKKFPYAKVGTERKPEEPTAA